MNFYFVWLLWFDKDSDPMDDEDECPLSRGGVFVAMPATLFEESAGFPSLDETPTHHKNFNRKQSGEVNGK